MHDLHTLHHETPLGDLLPRSVTHVLARNGVHTVEELKRAYPIGLLKMHGMGMLRFRQIEAGFFPGKSFTPARVMSPIRQIKGSSLNGALSPGTVQVLACAGITTVAKLLAMEPAQLLKIKSLGVGKLREIESVFFPGQHYELVRGRRKWTTLPDL